MDLGQKKRKRSKAETERGKKHEEEKRGGDIKKGKQINDTGRHEA